MEGNVPTITCVRTVQKGIHTIIPMFYGVTYKNDPQLATWVIGIQRKYYRDKKMMEERKHLLRSIGFDFRCKRDFMSIEKERNVSLPCYLRRWAKCVCNEKLFQLISQRKKTTKTGGTQMYVRQINNGKCRYLFGSHSWFRLGCK